MAIKYLLVIVVFQCFYAAAEPKCKLSKIYIDDYEPAIFHNTNNLLHSYDSLPDKNLQAIIIRGKVLDQNCIPVVNAKVYIWQVGLDGKYPYVGLRDARNQKLFNHKSSSSFLGSGIFITDNLGRFVFITMQPVSKLNYINFRAQYNDSSYLQTKYFINSNDDEHYFDIVVPRSVKR